MDINYPCLFSKKEMYVMTHDEHGRFLSQFAPKAGHAVKTDNMHLLEGIEFTTDYSMPILPAYNGNIDLEFHTFKERHKLSGHGQAIHFFMPDHEFEHATWHRLEQTAMTLTKFDAVIAPDNSLYVDAPEHLNRNAVYKSRFVGAYLTHCDIPVIPDYCWAGLSSLGYSLSGLPNHSVIALCGTGCRRSRSQWDLWCHAVQVLESEKHPTLLLIYGEAFDVPGIHTPVKFIPSYISRHFRK